MPPLVFEVRAGVGEAVGGVSRRSAPVAVVVGGAILVCCLILPLPADAGVVAKFLPPFASTHPRVANQTTVYAPYGNPYCRAAFAVRPSASPTSGGVRFAYNVSGHGSWGRSVCRVTENVSAGFRGPAYSASATSTLDVRYSWSLSWGAGTSSDGYVRIELTGGLYDNTSHTWVAGANRSLPVYSSGTSNDLRHPNSTASAVNDSLVLVLHVAMVRGHQYLFSTAVESTCSALGDEYPGNQYLYVVHHHGTAWVDLGLGANGGLLGKIVVG